jgi:hypothetical protein
MPAGFAVEQLSGRHLDECFDVKEISREAVACGQQRLGGFDQFGMIIDSTPPTSSCSVT